MVKLRHLTGKDLKKLEKQLEKVKHSVVVVGVTQASGSWFIHFLVQDSYTEDMLEQPQLNVEVAKPTQTKFET